MSISLKQTIDLVQQRVNARLLEVVPQAPASLYDPVRYIITAGGKRLRPILTYLCSFSAATADWVSAACAVELLHTFTLVHDDIMDNAPTRRGFDTVHVAYDLNTAILAGDVIIALAEECLSAGKYKDVGIMLREFSNGFRYVCEGQAFDKEFELRDEVSVDEYFQMIDLKSAKMIELAAVLGGYAAGIKEIEALRSFAHHLGIAFQLRDDLLDLTANEAELGKTIGGDIIEGKRTLLYLAARAQYDSLDDAGKQLLDAIAGRKATKDDVPAAKALFERSGSIAKSKELIALHTDKARAALSEVGHEATRNALFDFSEYLLHRQH